MKEHLGHAWMAPDDGPTDPEYAAADEGIDFRRRIEGELPFLRRIARRWHRDQANADDLIQETLLRALTNAQLWEPGSNLHGWLFTIMRNQFLAAAARSKRSDLVFDTIGMAEAGLSASLPEARLMIRDVERALRRLPSNQRTAVKFIGIDGKSYEEAAHLMRMSVAAVRCHLAAAANACGR
jgi:RNA polymerase sigma-70 factor, ECF subfamily